MSESAETRAAFKGFRLITPDVEYRDRLRVILSRYSTCGVIKRNPLNAARISADSDICLSMRAGLKDSEFFDGFGRPLMGNEPTPVAP